MSFAHELRQSPSSIAEWADGWQRDLTTSIRSLSRSPGLVIAVVLTLALGLGANAAVFSFLDQVFLRPPAGVASPGYLRRLWHETPMPAGLSKSPYIVHTLSYHQYRSVAAEMAGQAQLALYANKPDVEVGSSDAPLRASVTYATANYFAVLGVRPALGRSFTDAEADVHGASRVVVLSDAFWRKRFGADPAAVGTKLSVDGSDYTVIGVAPAEFTGIDLQQAELWLPLGVFPTRETARVPFWDSSIIQFSAFARMAPGTDDRIAEARATSAYLAAPVTDFAPDSREKIFFSSIKDARGPGALPAEVSIAVRLGFVCIIILLLTTANVVNLLLARAMSRRREAAVRLALGISRARLARLFVAESTLLALAAGAAALVSAQMTGALLRSLLLPEISFAGGALRWQVVVLVTALSVVTGILAGLVPGVRAGRTEVGLSLRAGAREGAVGRWRLPSMLVATQAALSVMLLVGAALFFSSLRNIQRLDIGFDVPRLAYATVQLPAGARTDTTTFSQLAMRVREAGARVSAVPGVEAVAFARSEPMTWFGRVSFYTATDSSDAPGRPLPTASDVSSEFFTATGMAFLRGAPFSDDPGASSHSVVVNSILAETFWPDRDPIGQCIHLRRRDAPCRTVVGVVQDAIRDRLTEDPAPQLYLPLLGSTSGQLPPVMVVRADPDRLELAMTHAARALRAVFPRAETHVVRMSDMLAPQYRPWQLGAALFSIFGVLGLLVAALGIYSSVSYSVTRRLHDIGVRIALGAGRRDVMLHVIRESVGPVTVGAALGSALAIAGARYVSSLLYGVDAANPAIIASVVVGMIVVAVVAASAPARRAARIDPVRVMLTE